MVSFLSLPAEVQGIIFTYLNALTPVSTTINSSSYPILVNRAFHKALLSTPRAWTNIQVDLSSAAKSNYKSSDDGIRLPYKWLADILAHSKACLIDVEVVGNCDYTTVKHGVVPPLHAALHRISELVLKPVMDSELLGLIAGLRGPAPNLERIVAQGRFWPGGDEFGGIRPSGASKLRSVTFVGAVAPLRNPLLRNLTHLELVVPMPPFSVRGIMAVLRACPDMQVFKFEGLCHWEEEEDLHEEQHLGPIVLPHLQTLTLCFDGATILLPYIRAPNLASLHIQRKVSTQDPVQQAALPTFLQSHRNPPPITSLTVDCIGMNTHQWIDCLELLPNLRSLTSKDKGFDDLLLEYVRLTNPLPKLEKWVTSWNFVGHKSVIEFLKSRNPPARRPSLPAIFPVENPKQSQGPKVSAIKHFELVGSRRPNDAAVKTIEFLMLASDPLKNGVLGNKFIMPPRDLYY
ncbi:hypothetical protein M407DRAFT_245890 [Tulasnella calospora MUT 4182]|uniref:F-box domain-containing protein n=1 Tax=Tulasnella calospora MUT 4182 TaxID=1051891 RepID=A0A0C3PYD6_9AGAM|nr:hypothetical protein M407DRAFT_245890 [Tulasnella calospora MUT 4182]